MRKAKATIWLLIVVGALAATIIALLLVERHYRGEGLIPTVLDDQDLWAQERARLDRYGSKAIALLGTSRIMFGIDPKRLHARLPGYRPVMLAVNGAYPLATLKHLATQTDFSGLIVVDANAGAFLPKYFPMQQPHIDHFLDDFGPSRAIHRRILTEWQRRMVISDPTYGLISAIRRVAFDQPPPQSRYAIIFPNRAGALDFRRIDPAPLAAHFAATQRRRLREEPAPAPEQWRAALAPIAEWVRMIEGRGGQVLFFCFPTGGEHRAVEEAGFPRALYWDKLSKAVGAPAIHADDVRALAGIATPDGSHVDQSDRDRLTDALAAVMLETLRIEMARGAKK